MRTAPTATAQRDCTIFFMMVPLWCDELLTTWTLLCFYSREHAQMLRREFERDGRARRETVECFRAERHLHEALVLLRQTTAHAHVIAEINEPARFACHRIRARLRSAHCAGCELHPLRPDARDALRARLRATDIPPDQARSVDQVKLAVVAVDIRDRAAQPVAIADEVRNELVARRFVK